MQSNYDGTAAFPPPSHGTAPKRIIDLLARGRTATRGRGHRLSTGPPASVLRSCPNAIGPGARPSRERPTIDRAAAKELQARRSAAPPSGLRRRGASPPDRPHIPPSYDVGRGSVQAWAGLLAADSGQTPVQVGRRSGEPGLRAQRGLASRNSSHPRTARSSLPGSGAVSPLESWLPGTPHSAPWWTRQTQGPAVGVPGS